LITPAFTNLLRTLHTNTISRFLLNKTQAIQKNYANYANFQKIREPEYRINCLNVAEKTGEITAGKLVKY
jgi:hypothetical protein